MKKETKKEKGWNTLSERKKLFIVVLLVLAIVTAAIYFYSEVKRVNSIQPIDQEEYSRILMVMDSSKWKASKTGYKALSEYISPALTGMCYISSDSEFLFLEFEGNGFGLVAEFGFSDGYIKGLVDMHQCGIFFSESLLNTGRAITLVIDDAKIVFYEED